jgi:hypothetical protein
MVHPTRDSVWNCLSGPLLPLIPLCACVEKPHVGVGSWVRVSAVVPSGCPEGHLASACLPPLRKGAYSEWAITAAVRVLQKRD